ncbi:MAG: response regulator [Thermodesulfobacteriota bacterium]
MKKTTTDVDAGIPVLVVEDDEGLNLLIVNALRRAGLRVEGVLGGGEALERTLADFSGLLLLDYQLTDMSGKELVERLAGAGKKIPFVLMTGHGDERIAVEMMKLGARDYLIKDSGFLDLLPRVVSRVAGELEKERRLAATEERLWRLEWLLTEGIGSMDAGGPPACGDLTATNTSPLLLRLLGKELLTEIAEDYLQLLGSAGAIHEKNGDYALSIVSSAWCRHLHRASRNLCPTGDNRQAMAGGGWLCHESCWSDSSKRAIESGEPVDIVCRGGLRIHALPILAGGEIVGAMNFGYGDPPTDPARLAEIAGTYGVTVEELALLARTYENRPPFIIEIAKKRLRTSAKLVGEIIERKLAEQRLQTEKKLQAGAFQVLALLNQPTGQREAVAEVTRLIRDFTSIEAVGIRLREGEDFPYYQANGFPRDFVEAENFLCARNGDGSILRDRQGQAVLECLCGAVLSGETDPALPFFTGKGSFVTNSTSDFLAATPPESRPARCRTRCHREGYESVALIPLRNGVEVIGLLQLNDRRRDMFPPETIEFFEGLAVSIAVSLGRRLAVEELLATENQLRQAQKMEAVGRLAGGVTHDFNNMLSVILGYTDMILSGLDPCDPLHKDMLEIKNAGRRSADLTRQLLAFARKQTILPRVLDLNELLTTSQKMLARLIGEDIELRFRPQSDLWNVLIDPSQFDQIVANLAVNARDAISGVGTVTIETANVVLDDIYCRLHRGFLPGEFVMLSFSDSGHGMGRETLEHIFEPFFTTKAEGKGTGLGLATIYGIVKQSNGFINVYSEPGAGATFRIYLPRASEGAEPAAAVPAATSLQGTETILIAEDEAQILQLAARILEKLGYTKAVID